MKPLIRSQRRRTGAFYTPAPLAARVVERVLAPLAGEVSVCDPACGDGVFLEAARDHLAARGVRGRLFGVDRDPEAVARARRALPGAEIECADALRLDWGDRTFDAVLGNPPWISFSGRHAQPLAEEERRFFARRYAAAAGWPSLHALFLELSVRLSRGRVGLLLPAQVCDLDGYGAVRAFVREHCRVAAVVDCGEEAFDDVTQPCVALVLERGGAPGGSAPFVATGADLRERLHAHARVPPEAFGDIGVHTGNCARRLLRPGGAPVREGKDVTPYVLRPPRRTLRLDGAQAPGDYFRAGPLDRYRAVPIVLRQTALRPIAALHEEPTYFRNSVLACFGVPGVPHAWVVAWLNSTVVGRFHRATVREASQRAFPQLKVKHLRALPAPDWAVPPAGFDELARAVAHDGRLDLEPALDALLSRWFGFDAVEHSRMRGWFSTRRHGGTEART